MPCSLSGRRTTGSDRCAASMIWMLAPCTSSCRSPPGTRVSDIRVRLAANACPDGEVYASTAQRTTTTAPPHGKGSIDSISSKVCLTPLNVRSNSARCAKSTSSKPHQCIPMTFTQCTFGIQHAHSGHVAGVPRSLIGQDKRRNLPHQCATAGRAADGSSIGKRRPRCDDSQNGCSSTHRCSSNPRQGEPLLDLPQSQAAADPDKSPLASPPRAPYRHAPCLAPLGSAPAGSIGRGVAQPGRALSSGGRGRRFESSLPDHFFRGRAHKAPLHVIAFLHSDGNAFRLDVICTTQPANTE